jgi:FixJ family two-component response regulator
MRRMAGDVLASRLSSTHPTLPVVIISGNRAPSLAADTGAPRQFLPKPVSAEALCAAIQGLTQKQRG